MILKVLAVGYVDAFSWSFPDDSNERFHFLADPGASPQDWLIFCLIVALISYFAGLWLGARMQRLRDEAAAGETQSAISDFLVDDLERAHSLLLHGDTFKARIQIERVLEEVA